MADKKDNQVTTSILCKKCMHLSEESFYCNMYNERLRTWCDVDKQVVKCHPCYDTGIRAFHNK